jgi:hypothetical protein
MHIVDCAIRTAAAVVRSAIPTGQAGLDEERLSVGGWGFMKFFIAGGWRRDFVGVRILRRFAW